MSELARAPLFVPLGPLHPHLVFEILAYAAGFQLYLWRRRRAGDFLDDSRRWSLVAAAIVGAALGAKLLALLNEPAVLVQGLREPLLLLGAGKTIVGGLLGGWLAVELAKRWLGVRRRTGDLYALPLCLGIAVGRVGCFLTGLADRTHGTPSALPWAVDFGDGVGRHPTQLYEIVFLIGLGALIWVRQRRRPSDGELFRLFLASYLFFRLLIDALKPGEARAGLSAIQWACGLGLTVLAAQHVGSRRAPHPRAQEVVDG